MGNINFKINRMSIFLAFFLMFSIYACETVGNLVNPKKKPVIDKIFALQEALNPRDTTTIVVEAHDPENEALTFEWSAEGGFLSRDSGRQVVWTAPVGGGDYTITVKAINTSKDATEGSLVLTVRSDEIPFVNITKPENGDHIPGLGHFEIEAEASHPNGIKIVEFYVDDILLRQDTAQPYKFSWQIEDESGERKIKVKAIRTGTDPGQPGVDSVFVTIEGVTPID